MAYSLRYWYNNKLTDGKVIRLEIYKKDSSAAAMEIGDVVQGLSLNIDGGEDNIDAPIVSTSLVMTFCDAYDHPEAEVKKCGNYAEFYTPDATLWKVVLLCKDAGASSFRTLWGGYVTPDSYEEDLTYRGSVTIVARDNIGHMADFPFDAEGDVYGTISFREIIEGAWAKIESPMSLVFHDEWMQTEGVSALDTRMNVTAFEDKSWHEAVEAALYAYGAVLRFIGDNKVKVSPLRYMPNYGGSVTHSEPVFMTGATRMLTPAVKRIEETASYELEAGAVIPKIEASDYTGETGTYRCKIDGIEIDGETFSTNEHDAPIWPISTLGFNDWYNGALATTLFFNVDAYDVGYFSNYRGLSDEIKRYMYIAANQVDARFVRVYKAMQSSDFVIKMQFGKPVRLNREYELEQSYGSFNLKEITYAITMEQNGVTTYYHGGDYWSATRKELRISFDATKENSVAEFPVAIGQNIGDALFCFEIIKIEYAQVGPSNETYGLYACIQSLSFDVPENISLLQTNRVNTNYSEENNVIITRDPAIAPAYNTTFLPSVIKNGIFYAEGLAYKPAKAWAFAGDTPQQMAVYNHLQLLAYYAKPNNVIEGSIVNGDVSRFAHIWQFEDKEHILVSGRYNFINGYIEGAILREFARYENLWGSTGGTQLPATDTSSETNIEASASASSSSNTYDNTTNVNFGGGSSSYLRDLLDVDVTASVIGSILYFNGTQWVDRSLDVLLSEMPRLGDWFYMTEDGKAIGTKFPFFSESEISANGLNLGGGTSGGGGLIQNVLGKSAFGTVASEDNATTFNAYAIDSLYKRIVELEGKDVEVDLSDYYTKQQTQNAITSALSPYIKATDADGKYAALASFNALQSSFDRLYSALNDDTSGVINTWNEVVDFVNEYSGSEDLSTILGKMNTDINARVKVSDFDTWKTDVFNPLSVTVTNLGKRVDTNTANINKLLGWFNVDADGNLFTTYNFYSTKEISANDISQGTGGGGSGLISSVLGVGSLGATLTNDNSVVFNAYATNEIYKATQGHASRIGVLESQVGQLTTQRTKVSVSDLLTTGTKIATITVDGVPHEVKGDFLPTSGGTITFFGLSGLTLTRNTDNSNLIHFKGGDNDFGYIGFGGVGKPIYADYNGYAYPLLHSGNVGDYALKTDGSNYMKGPLVLQDTTDISIVNNMGIFVGRSNKVGGAAFDYASFINIPDRGISQLQLSWHRDCNNLKLVTRIYESNNWSDWRTIAFTDSNVASATKLATARTIWGQSFDGTGNVSGDLNLGYSVIRGANNESVAEVSANGLVLGYSYRNLSTTIYGGDIFFAKDDAYTMTINSSGNVTIGSSNLAGTSAKLYVDGTARINGQIYTESHRLLGLYGGAFLYAGIREDEALAIEPLDVSGNWLSSGITLKKNGNVGIGNSNPACKLDVNGNSRIVGKLSINPSLNIYLDLTVDSSRGYIQALHDGVAYLPISLNPNGGNILIGTTTDSGYKLAADGGSAIYVGQTDTTTHAGLSKSNVFSICNGGDENFGLHTWVNSNGTALMQACYIGKYAGSFYKIAINPFGGNVGIGTNSPAYKLDVNGTLRATDAVAFGSTLTIAGATTHNGIAYFGGTTYYINTSGNANFNAISGSSLQVASLSNGGLLETSTLRVSSTSTFTGKTNHNGGIGTTSLNVSGTSTLSGHVGIGTSPHSTYALYVDGSLCCGPIDGGTASLGALYSNTHVPNSSETYDLGSTSYRWASVYGVGADFSGNVTVNGTLYANGTLYTNDIDGSNIYITASGNLYLTTASGYFGAQNQRWAIDGYGNYKGQSLYINPRDSDNEIIYDDLKKKTHGFPRENVAVFVNGDIAATGEISANALNQGSDIRFKHQLGDVTLDLDTIAKAPMFRFTWTNKENSRVQIGTSAQYWKDSARELVSVDKDDFHRLDYATLGVLIGVTLGKTVKNHEDRIKELETKVESLEEENRRLRYEC